MKTLFISIIVIAVVGKVFWYAYVNHQVKKDLARGRDGL